MPIPPRFAQAMVDPAYFSRYLNRLAQYIGPTPHEEQHPETRHARIQANRHGKRDEEVLALDLDELGPQACAFLKHMLIATHRYEVALRRFPNLRGLVEVPWMKEPVEGCLHCDPASRAAREERD